MKARLIACGGGTPGRDWQVPKLRHHDGRGQILPCNYAGQQPHPRQPLPNVGSGRRCRPAIVLCYGIFHTLCPRGNSGCLLGCTHACMHSLATRTPHISAQIASLVHHVKHMVCCLATHAMVQARRYLASCADVDTAPAEFDRIRRDR